MNITVARASGNEKREWDFALINTNGETLDFCLVRFRIQQRATSRHRFKTTDWYDAYEKRSCTMTLALVPQPADIYNEVVAQVADAIRVVDRVDRVGARPFAADVS